MKFKVSINIDNKKPDYKHVAKLLRRLADDTENMGPLIQRLGIFLDEKDERVGKAWVAKK